MPMLLETSAALVESLVLGAQRLQDALGDAAGGGSDRTAPGSDDGEFVAAEPRHHLALRRARQ